MARRLPAEWEEQDGVLLAWPHADTDWAPYLPAVEEVFTAIVAAVSQRETALVATLDPERTDACLRQAGVDRSRVLLAQVATNDTWTRDCGPLTVIENGRPLLLDFVFNGWGMKFAADQDNLLTRRLAAMELFAPACKSVGLVLEGGSIESDGAGTLLTTAECLLQANRNPHLDRLELEQALQCKLGVQRILWLENGWLAGDDTDSHVDTLARLCPDDTICYVGCDDAMDEHYVALFSMEKELQRFRTAAGAPYRLLRLPWPRPLYDRDGYRLPATYANFLVINGAVLVPTYADPADADALAVIGQAFPGREIIGIDCRPLIWQHGSLHCVTMQLPKGTLAAPAP